MLRVAQDECRNADAVRVALGRLEGAYALVVMHRDEPERLVGARFNAPLIVGVGDDESFLASDAAAIVAYTKRVVFLADGDVADLLPGKFTITDRAGTAVDRPIDIIPWSAEAAEKGGYAHFMLKEIHEQPAALTAAMTGRLRGDAVCLEELDPIRERLAGIDRVEMIACGTAYYASLVGAALFQDWLGVPARSTVASEFRYSPPPIDARTLVIAVTQSGETAANNNNFSRFHKLSSCRVVISCCLLRSVRIGAHLVSRPKPFGSKRRTHASIPSVMRRNGLEVRQVPGAGMGLGRAAEVHVGNQNAADDIEDLLALVVLLE